MAAGAAESSPLQELLPVTGATNLPDQPLALLVGDLPLRIAHRGGAVEVAEADAPARHVVRRHLEADAVAGEDADAVLAHLAAGIGEHAGAVGQLDPELGIRQDFLDRAFHLDHLFFAQARPFRAALGLSAVHYGGRW